MFKSIFCLFLLVITASWSLALDTSTAIFNPRFRTLKAEVEDNFMTMPVIRLGTYDRLTIKFDEIGEDNSYLEYRILHCNADWQPSRLIDSEFLDGFNSVRIEDFAFSSATFVHYVNYLITLPNDDTKFLRSGNYLLQVYDPDEPEDVLLQCRFQVSESMVKTMGSLTSRTDRGHNDEWQQLSLSLDWEALGNINPYQDLQIYVTRNVEGATRRHVKAPMRVSDTSGTHEHQQELIFPASNEYRRFESTSNTFPGMHVDSLRYMGSNYHVWLKKDAPRAGRQYDYDRTQHGRFIVKEYNASDSDIGADYITVHFLLEMDELMDKDVYVDGEFTYNACNGNNRMVYDRQKGAYTLEYPLKQGAYNYQYVARPKDSSLTPTSSFIEGNVYETDNEYSVEIYYTPPGARADRLVGYSIITGL